MIYMRIKFFVIFSDSEFAVCDNANKASVHARWPGCKLPRLLQNDHQTLADCCRFSSHRPTWHNSIVLSRVGAVNCYKKTNYVKNQVLFHRRTRASYVYNGCLAWYKAGIPWDRHRHGHPRRLPREDHQRAGHARGSSSTCPKRGAIFLARILAWMSVRDARVYTCTVHDKLSCTRLQNYTIGASLMSLSVSVSVSVPWNSSLTYC